MDADGIRKKFLGFFASKNHAVLPRARVVPDGDPTTLFTGSGMQPMIPYLLGAKHPKGTRLADSQTCIRAQDIDDVGDNRHTTFFEMLGNWSLGDYFKKEQITWMFEFLSREIGLDMSRIYITCYIGNSEFNIPRDDEAAEIWQRLFRENGLSCEITEMDSGEKSAQRGIKPGERIFFYNGNFNWWSRNGDEAGTPVGDPCGPDNEMFYEFADVPHDKKFGEFCHPNCDCGRFMEIGNNVFMAYKKVAEGQFERLEKPNIDHGSGLERIAAAAIDSPDIFKISLFAPIIAKLEELSGKKYDFTPGDLGYETVPDCWKEVMIAMRVIADHLRASVFLATDGVKPSNKEQGYVMRRLIRRAVRFAFDLGIEQNFLEEIVPVIADIYAANFPEIREGRSEIIATLAKEEKAFRQTLRKGLKEFEKLTKNSRKENTCHSELVSESADSKFKLYLGSYKPWETGEDFAKCVEMVGANKTAALITNAWDNFGWNERSQNTFREAVNFFAKFDLKSERLDLREYFDEPAKLAKKLEKIGLIYAFGGNTFILRRAFAQSGLDKFLPKLLEKGAVYGGFSAGSCLMTPSLHGYEQTDDPHEIPDKYDEKIIWDGLSLVGFAIEPHYRSDHPESPSVEIEVQNRLKKGEQLGKDFVTLRDGEVIIVRDGKIMKILRQVSPPAPPAHCSLKINFREQFRLHQNDNNNILTGDEIFTLYDTYGFPVELSVEEAFKRDIPVATDWRAEFDSRMAKQREMSQTAAKGTFKGGLGGKTWQHRRYHTATHLLQSALREIFGPSLGQHGSNINEERLRFDFNLDRKMTPEEIARAEELVNGWIRDDLPIFWREYPTYEALRLGAIGPFGERYGEKVKVYQMGISSGARVRETEPVAYEVASLEICGGPHCETTGQLATRGELNDEKIAKENGFSGADNSTDSPENKPIDLKTDFTKLKNPARFKIVKEESVAAGMRRIKAILE